MVQKEYFIKLVQMHFNIAKWYSCKERFVTEKKNVFRLDFPNKINIKILKEMEFE